MSSVLQQTLRGLCFDTGWCYAVFWKLKQQPRMMLTWEDAFYGPKMDHIATDSSVITIPTFGQKICGGLIDMEDPIGLSVAKMSYHVYSVGEGIIGRVAFTNKHQWVFSSNEKGMVADVVLNGKANAGVLPKKYPSGWEQQFAAGIKTIAVIAVPQGVVQLGSTRVIVEDLKLVGHAKALFGTLQNVPGAFLSDFVSKVQEGGTHTVYPLAVPAPHLPSRDLDLMNVQSTTLVRTPCWPVNMGHAMAGGSEFIPNLGCSGVGRLPMMLASQQMHPWPLPPVSGFQANVTHFHHSAPDKPCLESLSRSSFPFFKPSMGAPTLPTGGPKVNPPPRTGIISHLSLSSKVSSIALPMSQVLSSQTGHSSFSAISSLSFSAPMLESPEYLRMHGQNGPVSRTKSPGPADGNQIANKVGDVASSIESWKTGIITTKEGLLSITVTSGLANTRSVDCESLANGRQLAGARFAAEQPRSKPLETSRSVGLGTMSAKMLQAESTKHVAESSKHLAKLQQLDFGRSTESQPLLVAGHIEQGSHGTKNEPLLVGNQLTRESRQLISRLPMAESSPLVASTPLPQSFHHPHKPKHSFLKGGQFGGTNLPPDKVQSVSERSSVECCQPEENVSPLPMFSRRRSMHVETSTSSTIQEESCISDFFSMSAATSAFQCEQSIQTSATENSPISDSLELAKEFDNARKGLKELSCSELDLDQYCISSSLLCDDYFEDLQSSELLLPIQEVDVWNSGSADNSVEDLFTNELNNFDEFFAGFTQAVKSNSDNSKGRENLSGSKAMPCQVATTYAECEPTLHTLNSSEPFSDSLAKEVTFSSKEFPSVRSEPQFDRFVSSQIHPKVSFPCFHSVDGDTGLGCQEMAALPPAKRPLEALKRGKKRSRPGRSESARYKDRQKMQDRIQELRAIIPDGASCSIDILLDKVVEYMDSLQTSSQDSGKRTPNCALQSHDRGNDDGPCSEASSVSASWVMDSVAQGNFCPIVAENLSQPGLMLIEMLCEEHEIFLKAAQTVRRLGLTILTGVMEVRNNLVWARYVTKGSEDVHRVRVLWALMQLLASKAPS